MPTPFNTSFTAGDLILATEVSQYATPINNIENGTAFYAADTSSSTSNYTATISQTLSSYSVGMVVNFVPNNNNAGTATINLNSVGSNIIKKGSVDLDADDLVAGRAHYLVYVGSHFQLVGSSTSGGSGSSNDLVMPGINGEAFTIKKGQPVKLYSSGNPVTVKLAQADDIDNAAFGVAGADASSSGTFDIIKMGLVTKSDWTDIMGSTDLTFNDEYFLAQGTLGFLNNIPPTGSGDVAQQIGKAVSDTGMYVMCGEFYIL